VNRHASSERVLASHTRDRLLGHLGPELRGRLTPSGRSASSPHSQRSASLPCSRIRLELCRIDPTARWNVSVTEDSGPSSEPSQPVTSFGRLRNTEREAMTVQTGTAAPWPRVSVVVPALNEARNLPHVFARMPPNVHEVILVDGYSVDDTVAVARRLRPDVHIVRQNRTGKGNALACGFAAATGDIVAMVDADGSADPGEIPQFVRALLKGADFAKGTRFAVGGGSGDITRLRSLGNRVLTTFFNLCYRRDYSDLCYGFNVFWRCHAPALGLDATSPPPPDGDGRLWGDGFEVETLIHIRVAKAGLVVTEVPSFEHPRIHGVSNLNAFHDGIRVLRTILTERRRTRRPLAAAASMTEPAHGQKGVVVHTSESSITSVLAAGPE
jgi:Glycosyl transferase family 2